MTLNQLSELIRHIEEEHNFFNRKSGQRMVKNITPHVDLRRTGVVTAVDMHGYGWKKKIVKHETTTPMFNSIMEYLDTPIED